MSIVIIILAIVCFLQFIALMLVTKYFLNDIYILRALKDLYKKERNEHIDRRVDLETAILWWVNERMKGFSDDQYGKGKLKELISEDKCIKISDISK